MTNAHFLYRKLKTLRLGFRQPPLEFFWFPRNKKLLVISILREYTNRKEKSENRRNYSFPSHSSRASSTSKAKVKGLSLKDISKAVEWISNSTISRFYNKPGDENFRNCIIEFDEQINWIVWVLIFNSFKFNTVVYEAVIYF